MSLRPKKAMVLAAGFGERMRPLTDDRPKPLVLFNGRPLIDYVLDRLARAGIEECIVNVHYRADQLEAHLRNRSHPRIRISDERAQLLDTGGGVMRALDMLGDGPFLIHNSDSHWISGPLSNVGRMIAGWDPEKMDSLLLLASSARSIGYDGPGDFMMDQSGRIRRRREKEVTPFVFAGVSIADRRLFEQAPPGPFSLNRLWSRAIDADRLFGIRHDGHWMHLGTPQALTDAERLIHRGDLD